LYTVKLNTPFMVHVPQGEGRSCGCCCELRGKLGGASEVNRTSSLITLDENEKYLRGREIDSIHVIRSLVMPLVCVSLANETEEIRR